MLKIVYTRPDGGVSVTTPTPALIMAFHLYGAATGPMQWEGPPVARPDSVYPLADAETLAIAFVRAKDVPADATNVAVLEAAALPVTRRFRNCWRQTGIAVPHVDMPLARTQRMTEVRAERDKRLVVSDGLVARALDIGTPAEVAALRQYHQALRDVPQAIDLGVLATPEALAAFEPAWPVEPT